MNLNLLDWCVIFGGIAFFIFFAQRTRKYTKSVADFLAANRSGGRYLIGISEGMAAVGAVSVVAVFQMYYEGGLASVWWYFIGMPVQLVIGLTGWVIYRFRQTRALTMAQFLEMRYTKRFRIFAGSVCFLSGIINFGIFPAVGANFFMRFCGFPEHFTFLGLNFSTYYLLTLALVSIALYFAMVGGQISVLTSNFIQATFFNVALLIILAFLLIKFPLTKVFEGLMMAPENASRVNPFNIGNVEGFSMWYFVILFFSQFYAWKAYQGSQAYNSSAENAHEAKMGVIIGFLREWAFFGCLTMLPLVAYMIMHHPDYAEQASQIQMLLQRITNEQLQSQMTTPIAMTTFIPAGLIGAFVLLMFAAFLTTNNSALHSWGSILVQDVIIPLKKGKQLSPKRHILYLRLSMVGVGIFVYIFSIVFRQTQHILLYMLVSGAIWTGGAGSVIAGGLYWKRGTTAGAYAAIIAGAAIAIAGLVLEQIWQSTRGVSFPIDYKWMSAISMVVAIITYTIVSLLSTKPPFNLDRMLHRGKYALEAQDQPVEDFQEPSTFKARLKAMLNTKEGFTMRDKVTYGVAIGYHSIMFGVFIFMTIFALIVNLSDQTWADFQRYFLAAQLLTSFVVATWLTCGGFRDLRNMFIRLRKIVRNDLDDGTVVDHHNLDEKPRLGNKISRVENSKNQ